MRQLQVSVSAVIVDLGQVHCIFTAASLVVMLMRMIIVVCGSIINNE